MDIARSRYLSGPACLAADSVQYFSGRLVTRLAQYNLPYLARTPCAVAGVWWPWRRSCRHWILLSRKRFLRGACLATVLTWSFVLAFLLVGGSVLHWHSGGLLFWVSRALGFLFGLCCSSFRSSSLFSGRRLGRPHIGARPSPPLPSQCPGMRVGSRRSLV